VTEKEVVAEPGAMRAARGGGGGVATSLGSGLMGAVAKAPGVELGLGAVGGGGNGDGEKLRV
jgi:hypothetical protein